MEMQNEKCKMQNEKCRGMQAYSPAKNKLMQNEGAYFLLSRIIMLPIKYLRSENKNDKFN